MNIRKTIQEHAVLAFIVLTLGISFSAFFLPIPTDSAFATIAFLLLPVPCFVAFVMVTIIGGRRDAMGLFRESLRWRASWKWYLSAFAIGFAIHFGSSVLALLTGYISIIEVSTPNVLFIAVFPFAMLEEIGWRGFALRRLLIHYSPFVSTLIVGVPWALLHFALFLSFVSDVSPIAEGLIVLSFAFPLTWVYVKSDRNVVVATILHGGLNAFAIVGAAIPPESILWFVLSSACLIVTALVIVDWRMWFTISTEEATMDVIPSIA